MEARYDATAGKWNMAVLGGGFDLNGVLGYSWSLNMIAGVVPVTGEFGFGAQANLAFRVYKPIGQVPAGVHAAEVEDYLTVIRINMYVKAFGGLSFDYSLVALKIGVFGQVNLTYVGEFLNRSIWLHLRIG